MKIQSLPFVFWAAKSIFASASGADEAVIDRVLRDSNDAAAGKWSSLTENLGFSRILSDSKFDKVAEQVIDRTLSSTTPVASSSSCSFMPASQNDYYPEYAIAWRYLGISVDCNYQGNGHRSLQNNNGNMCARVLLYAVVRDISIHRQCCAILPSTHYHCTTLSTIVRGCQSWWESRTWSILLLWSYQWFMEPVCWKVHSRR